MMDFAEHFQANRERPFLVDAPSGLVVSYGGFEAASWSLAQALTRAGIAPGCRIAAMLTNGVEFACLYFACLFTGAVAVPVNAKYTAEDREYILHASQAQFLACGAETADLAPEAFRRTGRIFWIGPERGAGQKGWSLADSPEPGAVALKPPATPDLTALFTLNFTSGTTGRPKGIFHTAKTLLENARAFGQAMSIDASHVFYHMMPMSYMAGLLNSLLCPFAAGASVVLDREFDARMAFSFWEPLVRHGVNCMWTSPSALAMIIQLDRGKTGESYAPGHMRFVAACTAALRPEVQTAFEDRYRVPVLPSFGMSETLINTLDHMEGRCAAGATGFALPGVALRITGEDGAILAQGAQGDIWVRSPSLMIGYLDTATGEPQAASADGWFASGDMGSIDSDGALRITDRKKDLIVRGGVNISPQKVEAVLSAHPMVEEAAVVGVADAARGEKVAAVLRLREAERPEAVMAEALALCRERLEPMSWPECIRVMDEFPRSATGKVDKKALRKLLGEA